MEAPDLVAAQDESPDQHDSSSRQQRIQQPAPHDSDDHVDMVFRFRLDPVDSCHPNDLTEFYRQSICDLLRIVRLCAGGKPVIVDAFAFLNKPHELIPILGPGEHAEAHG